MKKLYLFALLILILSCNQDDQNKHSEDGIATNISSLSFKELRKKNT